MPNRRGKSGKWLIFLGFKIMDSDRSHEIKGHLVHGRKTMANLDRGIKKQRHYFANKGLVFPVVMYRCENWTIKKAEHHRTDTFELWCWRRLFRVHWTAGSSNQSILEEISPEHSRVGPMLNEAEVPILWPFDAKSQLTAKDPNAGKDWRQKKGEAEDEMVR